MAKPIIKIQGSEKKGTAHIKSVGTRIAPEIETRVIIDGQERWQGDPDYYQQFDVWLDRTKNKNAPAITDSDFQAIADRWGIADFNWIKAVFQVESAGKSYNPDGSSKILCERHLNRRNIKKAYPKLAGQISKRLGGNLYSMRTGGYKGGPAEWERIKQTCCGIAEVTNDFNGALDVALSGASFGGPQILGKHAKLLGYSSPRQMVEEFHEDEDNQLEGFVRYVEKNGLEKHLRNAAKAGSTDTAYKHIVKFAKGYNGRLCCDEDAKGKKNYAALILRAYRSLSSEQEQFPPIMATRSQMGNAASAITKLASALGVSEVAGFTDLMGINIIELANKAGEMKDKAAAALKEADGLREQVASFAEKSAELNQQLSSYETWLGMIILILGVSLAGNLWSAYARWDDRRKGYK